MLLKLWEYLFIWLAIGIFTYVIYGIVSQDVGKCTLVKPNPDQFAKCKIETQGADCSVVCE